MYKIYLFIIGLCFSVASSSTESLSLYFYNTPPPLNTNMPGNLSDRLSELFNGFAKGEYIFSAHYLPRRRLDRLIAKDSWQGAVIWANPAWFGDSERTRYLWSDPLATDYNLVLSNKKHPLEYENPESLAGLKLGGILGHVYPEFESLIKSGRLTREDAGDYVQNLMKLKLGRVDVIFLPASALDIFRQQFPEMDEWLYISKRPRNVFRYHIFCSRSNPGLMRFFNRSIARLQSDPQWQRTMASWKSHLQLF